MATNVSIDEEAIRPIVAQAVMDQIGPERRDRLVAGALEYLLQPGESNLYGRRERTPSPLERALQEAVVGAARSVVNELLAQPEYGAKVRAAVREGMDRALAERDGENGYLFVAIGNAVGDRVAAMLRGES